MREVGDPLGWDGSLRPLIIFWRLYAWSYVLQVARENEEHAAFLRIFSDWI